MAVMIDANIFLSYLFRSDKLEAAKRILRYADDPVTILDVLEEVVYVGLSLNHGSKGFKLKKEIKELGFCERDRLFMANLMAFQDEYGIRLVKAPSDFESVIEAMAEELLLPSDALIVAACRHNGISCIATFDSDFKGLKGFEILGEQSE
ncbi:MAG: PIN domain-containing protein [Methanotrichaceae archaeon]|nr:PIN domain-containing protein [Methanotrichaceae archaeon]